MWGGGEGGGGGAGLVLYVRNCTVKCYSFWHVSRKRRNTQVTNAILYLSRSRKADTERLQQYSLCQKRTWEYHQVRNPRFVSVKCNKVYSHPGKITAHSDLTKEDSHLQSRRRA